MRALGVVASVAVVAWLAACSSGDGDGDASMTTTPASTTETTTRPSTTETTTRPSTTLPDGLDVRRGTADGDTWVLYTRTTTVDGELCLRLVWDGDLQGWSSCYVVDAGMGALPWVDPYLPHGDANVHFLVGLAPLGSRTVQARRGATVLGEGEVFDSDTLQLGRLGFAMPLTVPEVSAVADAVDVPGLDRPASLGVLPPLEVSAYDGSGVEVARGGRLVGTATDVPALVVGDDAATALQMLFGTQMTAGGGVFPWDGSPAQYAYVVVAAGAMYDVTVGGHTERRDLVPIPATSPPMYLAVAMVGPDDMMSATFAILDADGRVLEIVPLAQYLGG